ncbi:MAG: hypothetical protein EOM40_04270 [Clostridia bacterium]|nr:hypothetical protein [Clostridia bacterium]NCC44538.1 hypothetical protein [Clostridia bacterium]
MKKKGSVTLFFSLLMAVLLVLVQVVFRSVQIAGGRVQAEAGVEEGLYSVFAGYDRELFEKYHVFLLDGGYGTGQLQPGIMHQKIEDSLARSCAPGKNIMGVRGENLWKISKYTGAITGYTLATDQQGRAFKLQAIDYMKDTAGIQGIQLLLGKMEEEKQIVADQEKEGTLEQAKEAQSSYEQAKKQTQEQAQEQAQEMVPDAVPQPVQGDFVNPLDVIAPMQKMGILSLVLPQGADVSQGSIDGDRRYEKRNCESGMGTLFYGDDPNTVMGNLIFQEYMMQHLNSYTDSSETGNGLDYQLEYVAAGKSSDLENLKSVVKRLLLMREAANMAYLIQSAACQSQIHEISLIICASIGLPALEGVVSLVLGAAWAFGESILDVRQLLSGGNIPLIKSQKSWVLSLENLSKLPQILQNRPEKESEGLDYEEYLRIMISLGKADTQVFRTMDVAEQTMRQIEGKEEFRMDLAVSYLQVKMDVTCSQRQFSIQRDYGYEM